MEDLKILNQRLIDIYGYTHVDLPKYRLTWSTGITEKRFGTFNDWIGSIFVRQETGMRVCIKYPFHQDRWILEYCVPNVTGEIVDCQFIYEMIWCFENDKTKEPVEPIWKYIEILVACHQEALKTGAVKPKNPWRTREQQDKEWDRQEKEEMEAEEKLFYDMLGEDMRTEMFEDEAAISFSGMDARPSKQIIITDGDS